MHRHARYLSHHATPIQPFMSCVFHANQIRPWLAGVHSPRVPDAVYLIWLCVTYCF